MKRTSSKLVALLLALVLCISAVYTTAFASEDEAESVATQPKIISQNVMYGGNFSLMFAVEAASCSGDTVTLSVYNATPAEGLAPIWTKTISTSGEKAEVNGISSFVFTTPGVAAKDMDKNFYIVAESAGISSEVKKYSVAEYLYERLYGNGVAFGTSALELAQAKLYFSTLEFGRNAQDLLFNYDEDPSNDRTTFVTDLCYVTVNPLNGVKGTLNGESSALLVNKGESVSVGSATIRFNGKDWAAGEFAVQSVVGSEVVSTETLSENTVVANSHLIIDPTRFFSVPTEPDAETFEEMTTVDTTRFGFNNVSSMELVDVDGDSKLKYTFAYTNTSNHYAYFKLGSTSKNAKSIVWEADVDIDNLVKDGQAAGTSVNSGVRIVIGAVQFNINVNTTGFSCYDSPDNWYATISTSTDHKAHIRIEYFETTDANGAAVFDTKFYVDGKLCTSSGAKKYKAYDASKSVDNVTQVAVTSDYTVSGEYYFDNVKLFKTYEPEELLLSEYRTFDNSSSLDSSVIALNSYATGSIVEADEGKAAKITWGTSGNGTATFLPIVTEENADRLVFEYTFTNNYAQTVLLTFYAGSTAVYDFRFNDGATLTSESNTVSWGTKAVVGTTNTIRFELYLVGDTLAIDVYFNNELKAASSAFGKKIDLTGKSEDFINSITKVVMKDTKSGVEGDVIIDNVRFSKLNTAN